MEVIFIGHRLGVFLLKKVTKFKVVSRVTLILAGVDNCPLWV